MPVIINGTTGISGVDGSAGTPAFQGSDANTGIRFGTDIVSLVTGGSDRLYIDSSGRVGLGTTSVDELLHLEGTSGANTTLKIESTATAAERCSIHFFNGAISRGRVGGANDFDGLTLDSSTTESAAAIRFRTGGTSLTTKMTLTAGGALGIGIANPSFPLHLQQTSGGNLVNFTNAADADFQVNCTSGTATVGPSVGQLAFKTNNTERVRIDTAGKLLVSTSSSRILNGHNAAIQISGTDFSGSTFSIISNENSGNAAYLFFAKQRSGSPGGSTIVQNNDKIGQIRFNAADGTDLESVCAQIDVEIDGTPGVNDVPGRLIFAVAADGTASPSEAFRISNDRSIAVTQTPGKYTISTTENATSIANGGTVDFSNFSGLILVTDHATGQTQIWITGGGNVTSLGTAGGTAGSVAYNGGANGYRWTNNTGFTRTFGFFCIRTRSAG